MTEISQLNSLSFAELERIRILDEAISKKQNLTVLTGLKVPNRIPHMLTLG